MGVAGAELPEGVPVVSSFTWWRLWRWHGDPRSSTSEGRKGRANTTVFWMPWTNVGRH